MKNLALDESVERDVNSVLEGDFESLRRDVEDTLLRSVKRKDITITFSCPSELADKIDNYLDLIGIREKRNRSALIVQILDKNLTRMIESSRSVPQGSTPTNSSGISL